jgi:hypothetical protein
MHRIGVILGLATLLAIGSSVTSHAAEHAKPHAIQGTHAQAMSSASCPNPALCGGSCPHAATALATTAAASVQHLNGAACPVSDPSKCPASCRRTGAASTTAVATNTRH